jgi:hypothetical protein
MDLPRGSAVYKRVVAGSKKNLELWYHVINKETKLNDTTETQ